MTGAADDHPPIAPPDTRPVPSGWVMLAKAFTSVAYIVDDPEEAAHELRRALLAGRVHCLRRRFFEAGIEDATLSRTFWRGIKFYAAKDGRGWDILQIRTWLTKGADDSFISKCVLYVWRADINAIWPSAVPDETGLELVGSEPIVTTQVLKHTEAAPIELLKPAEAEAEPSKLVGTTPIIDQAAQSQTAKRAGRPEHLVPTSLQRLLQSGGEPTNAKVPTARRLVTEKIAEHFAAHYINSEQAAGRSPTLRGLEAAAKSADMHGGREYLRAAFRRLRRVRRGRPPKASQKIAEK